MLTLSQNQVARLEALINELPYKFAKPMESLFAEFAKETEAAKLQAESKIENTAEVESNDN